MKRAVRLFPKLALLGVVACAGCGNTLSNPAPSLGSISPNNVTAGSPGFTLTVKGSNFVFGTTVLWNGLTRVTTYISRSELQAIIRPTDVEAPGTAKVNVITGGPGGGKSAAATFTINPQASSVPTITSLSPQAALAGGAQFFLFVNGTNFASNSVVTWNGSNLATTPSGPTNTQVQATVPASDIEVAGTVQVGVLNSAPGGGLSNLLPFTVNNPLPQITSVSPASAQAGGATFTVTVNGSGFACAVSTTTTQNGTTTTTCTTSASVINWNGIAQTTTFINTSQVTASIDASLIASAQAAQVTVTNPPPGGGTSLPAVFNVIPSPSGSGLPELVDISTAGIQGSSGVGNPGRSGPAVTGGGRFIAFSSVSQNLVSGLTNNVANVFIHDSCIGVTGCTPSTALASIATNGALSDADSLDPSLSTNGRFVAFDSRATTLVPGVTSGVAQIYLRDTCTGAIGCTPSTTLVSVAPDGASAGDGTSLQPFLSPDGQFVVFASTATNLVSGVTIPAGAQEIYLRTTCAGGTSGCTPATTLVSLAPDGATPADGLSSEPVVVAGGRFVAFSSTATNLVSAPSGGIAQVYWRDTCTGVSSGCTPATALVSVAPGGAAAGNAASSAPALGADGRFVSFASAATNLVSPNLPSGTAAQIFERDTCTGASGCTPATALVSVASDGSSSANAAAVEPAMDSTGRYVAFSSAASNIATAANNAQAQIFVRDTCAEASGCTPATALVSESASGGLGNASSSSPAVDAAGHFAAFVSFASNLVGNDVTPTLDDVFLAITTF